MRILSIAKVVGVLPAAAWVALAACGVPEEEHQAKLAELNECRTVRDRIAQERDTASEERDTLKANMEEVDAKFQDRLSATQDELDELRKQRATTEKQLQEFQNLTKRFQEMIDTEGIEVRRRRGRLMVALPSGVLFPSGQAELSPQGSRTLARVASKIKDFDDRRFIVAGHTDNIPVGDIGFKDNWELSTARALTVTRFLVEQGLDSNNLVAAGYSEHDPVATNRTKFGRQRNRRIELILEPKIPNIAPSKLRRLSGSDQGKGKGKKKRRGQ